MTVGVRPRVSILLPTFNRAGFIHRAIQSAIAQRFASWELVIVDDGSSDETGEVVRPFLSHSAISFHRTAENRGLGAALNRALRLSRGEYIAYLPSDDLYASFHLESLVECLDGDPSIALAFSGVRHHYNQFAPGQIEGLPLQLVQVMHRRQEVQWIEREELVTDDLERMYWSKLTGARRSTGQISATWVNHPEQRSAVIREPEGGLPRYKQHFGVSAPLHFHSSVGNDIDERERYHSQRERSYPRSDGLTILLVGELAYNSDRVLALRERGHSLFGLWIQRPHWYNMVGPVPFGGVVDLDFNSWRSEIDRIKPDVIYGLLNWQAVPLAHEVLHATPHIPFVWHFKEAPFLCMANGTWPLLVDLSVHADGVIHSTPEMSEWYRSAIPRSTAPQFVLDGDLPKAEWFTSATTEKLSKRRGEYHTVCPGRPIGLTADDCAALARSKVHLHFYGDFTQGEWRRWIAAARERAEGFLHLHNQVDCDRWVPELSQYDAGWLHYFRSQNGGDIQQADWEDLNYPARLSTLAAAGLPVIQRDNTGSLVAMQTLVKRIGHGIFINSMEDLASQLQDSGVIERKSAIAWERRHLFTFDHYVDDLIAFFHRVIASHKRKKPRAERGSIYRVAKPAW